MLQCIVACCSVLQCVLYVWHAELHTTHMTHLIHVYVVVCCSVLQRAAACCSMLQRVAVCVTSVTCVALHHTHWVRVTLLVYMCDTNRTQRACVTCRIHMCDKNSCWDCYGSFDKQRLFSIKFARFRNWMRHVTHAHMCDMNTIQHMREFDRLRWCMM